jgi:16S rRNA (guanine966-N2)-methyltransferase
VTLRQDDALRLLAQGRDAAGLMPFNVVFVDPPFGKGLVAPVLWQLVSGGWLAPDARVYVEQESTLPVPTGWEILRERTGGQARGFLLARPDWHEVAEPDAAAGGPSGHGN